MYIRISIPDIVAITAIGVTAWLTNDHAVGWSMWIGFGSFGAGRLVQWIISETH